jgi:uncharacterized membrane protein YphA (DoxX/SURF4 family)
MAQAETSLAPLAVPAWKNLLSWLSAILLGALFLASGIWKITDVQATAIRMGQARVPDALTLPAALFFGIAETVGAVLLFVPRLRRWGAVLLAFLLVAFLGYFAINYNTLRGADCSCIPWLKRVVGPGFFISDAAMLALAALAWLGARRSEGKRAVALVTGVVAVFAGVSYGVGEVRQTGTKAPESILIEGRPYSLTRGKVFVFYFDPQCMHCFDAAQRMSRMQWGDTRVVGVPISQPHYAEQFMRDTNFHMAITSDLAKLREVFPYTGVPEGVALENGREKAPLTRFEGDEPVATLRQLGFAQ